MNPVEKFRATVRSAVGLPQDSGTPPDLLRLGLYRCTVSKCASDGSSFDLQPEDARLPPQQAVPVRVGIPGAVVVIAPGAVVLLGWEKGDPSKPYCVPSFESGATVTKLSFSANEIDLGGNSYSLLKTETLLADLSALMGYLVTWVPLVVTAVATAPSGTAADPGVATQAGAIKTAITGGTYKSTIVKNG